MLFFVGMQPFRGQSYKRFSCFFKACLRHNLLRGFIESYNNLRFFACSSKKASRPRTLSVILGLNLGFKPQEKVTNKKLDLGQTSVEA